MAAATALQQPAEFRWVCNLAGMLRLAFNLSGFGRRLDRVRSPRAERIELATEDGETIVIEASGSGRPLLLVHGLGGSRHDWDAALGGLARTHRVYTLDLRGHGARAGTETQATLERMARDIALVIERLSLERPLLAGHSMGALVTMQYLKQYGAGKLGGVCLIDQSPRITVDAGWQLGLFGSLTAGQLRARLAGLRGLLRRLGLGHLVSLLESLAETDFRSVVAQLTLPTLVVLGGASNHYGGLPLANYYRAALARGTVVTYPESAHSPHRQEPQRFAEDLASFAARNGL